MRCAEAARQRRDPLLGTAPPARRWLLVEQPSGWGRDSLDSLAETPDVRARVARALTEAGARLQLIRRPASRGADSGTRGADAASARRWYVVTTGRADAVAGSLREGWAGALTALEAPSSAEPSEREAGPLVLVCTNGRHDPCCAIEGRPVAAALAAEYPQRTWETTHLGGDRFAANLLVLPEGALYGGVSRGTAVDVLAAHLRGQPRWDALRGVAGFSPHEQVAVVQAARALDRTPWDSRWGVDAEAGGVPGAAHQTTTGVPGAAHHATWARTVRYDDRPVAHVVGHDETRAPERLTCSAARPSTARVPVVDRVDLLER